MSDDSSWGPAMFRWGRKLGYGTEQMVTELTRYIERDYDPDDTLEQEHAVDRVVSFLRGEWGVFTDEKNPAGYVSRLRDADTIEAMYEQLRNTRETKEYPCNYCGRKLNLHMAQAADQEGYPICIPCFDLMNIELRKKAEARGDDGVV